MTDWQYAFLFGELAAQTKEVIEANRCGKPIADEGKQRFQTRSGISRRWQVNSMIRLLLIIGLAACGIVLVALAFVQRFGGLTAPVPLMLFVLTVVGYLLPTGLAVYRNCKATIWIVLLNVLLGWTMFGWVVALGWAASAKIREPAHSIGTPPHPVLGG